MLGPLGVAVLLGRCGSSTARTACVKVSGHVVPVYPGSQISVGVGSDVIPADIRIAGLLGGSFAAQPPIALPTYTSSNPVVLRRLSICLPKGAHGRVFRAVHVGAATISAPIPPARYSLTPQVRRQLHPFRATVVVGG